MKRKPLFFSPLIIAAIFLSLASLAFADVDVWHSANQVTVSWDAVRTTTDGEPIATGTIEYGVSAAGIDRSSPTEIWRGSENSTVIALPDENRFLLGVKAYRVVDGDDVGESEFSWSDDPDAVKDGQTFGIVYFKAISRPTGVRNE